MFRLGPTLDTPATASSHTSPRKASLGAKLALLGFSTLLMLALAEGFFRLTSPHVIRHNAPGLTGTGQIGQFTCFADTVNGRRLIPNSRVTLVHPGGSALIEINAQGFRNPPLSDSKAPGEKRILVLGDSITFAAATDLSRTYVKQAEALVAAQRPASKATFINAGVEGIGTQDEIDILVENGLAISPDVVVLGFFLNDSNPPDRLASVLANPGFIRSHSVFAQTIYRAYKMHQFRNGQLPETDMYRWTQVTPPPDLYASRESLLAYAKVAEKDWGAAWNPESWPLIDRQLARLRELADKHRFRVVVLAFPVKYQVYAHYYEDTPQQQIAALADKYGFDFLDLLPVLRQHNTAQNLFGDWCHPTDHGYAIVGQALGQFMLDRVFIESMHRPAQP